MTTQRVSVITLAVKDVPRARAFYEAWGWKPAAIAGEDFVAFQCGGTALALFPLATLAEEVGCELGPLGTTTITVAQNHPSATAVDQAY
jgi:catechol 2,3-dioxygenase-like lactoylglutathione lyase family enzyme